MADLTKLMKGPTEAEPVQEQPKLSREEYAVCPSRFRGQ